MPSRLTPVVLQLTLLVILDMYHHMYQVWIHPELQMNNIMGIYKNKGRKHFNKLKPWNISLHQEVLN